MRVRVRKDTLGVKKATQFRIVIQQQKSKEMKWFAVLATVSAHENHNWNACIYTINISKYL